MFNAFTLMHQKTAKQLYVIEVELPNGLTRFVKVQASSREVAEHRAIKRVRNAVRVKKV